MGPVDQQVYYTSAHAQPFSRHPIDLDASSLGLKRPTDCRLNKLALVIQWAPHSVPRLPEAPTSKLLSLDKPFSHRSDRITSRLHRQGRIKVTRGSLKTPSEKLNVWVYYKWNVMEVDFRGIREGRRKGGKEGRGNWQTIAPGKRGLDLGDRCAAL